MTIKRTFIVLLFLLMPLVTYALPLSNLPGMSSNPTLFFFNTLYSSRLLNIISHDTCFLGSRTMPSPNPYVPAGGLLHLPSRPLQLNGSCGLNPFQPTTQPAPVPEPSTLLLLGGGLLCLAGFWKKTK